MYIFLFNGLFEEIRKLETSYDRNIIRDAMKVHECPRNSTEDVKSCKESRNKYYVYMNANFFYTPSCFLTNLLHPILKK